MRAEYFPQLSQLKNSDTLTLNNREHHHLISVARIQEKEPIMLLDGKGTVATGLIRSIDSKETFIEITFIEKKEKPHHISIAMGLCKKEAMEIALKMSVELGVNEFIPLKTSFSQKNFIKEERVERVLISSLKQSN